MKITPASKQTKINFNLRISNTLVSLQIIKIFCLLLTYPFLQLSAQRLPMQMFTILILTRSTLSLVVHGSNGLVSKSRATNLDKEINTAHAVSVSMPNIQASL